MLRSEDDRTLVEARGTGRPCARPGARSHLAAEHALGLLWQTLEHRATGSGSSRGSCPAAMRREESMTPDLTRGNDEKDRAQARPPQGIAPQPQQLRPRRRTGHGPEYL